MWTLLVVDEGIDLRSFSLFDGVAFVAAAAELAISCLPLSVACFRRANAWDKKRPSSELRLNSLLYPALKEVWLQGSGRVQFEYWQRPSMASAPLLRSSRSGAEGGASFAAGSKSLHEPLFSVMWEVNVEASVVGTESLLGSPFSVIWEGNGEDVGGTLKV